MLRAPCCLVALFLVAAPCDAQEMAPLPAPFKKQMESMEGSWTFEGTQGARTFSGEETIRLVNNGAALLQEGFFDLGDGNKEHYVILSGWDGTERSLLVRGFTSDGVTWTGVWKGLDDGVWKGTASGSPATFEVGEDSMRYEDSGDGTPWVSEFTRKQEES